MPTTPNNRPRWGRIAAGVLLGTLVTYPAVFAAMLSGGTGHGHYVAARALFPVPMLLTLWTGNTFGPVSIALALGQFSLYGAVLGASRGRGVVVAGVIILALHLLAAWGCFAGLVPNFS